jgi:O-antigen/teichoic acid export membrane protein
VHLGLPAAAAPAAASLSHGVVWTTVGAGIYVACQYAMLVALAKLGSPVLVGQFALALGVTAPVVILSQMQLRQLQVTDAAGRYRFGDYFACRLVFSAAALAVVGVIIAFAGYPADTGAVVALVGVAKGVESVSDIVHGKLQRQERLDAIAWSLMGKGILSLAAFTVALWTTRSLVLAVGLLAVAWGAVFLAYDVPVLRQVLGPGERLIAWRWPAVVDLTVLAFPLALTAGLVSLGGNLPRYFLESLRGTSEVGFFAVASAPLALVTLFTGAIVQTTMARSATHFQAGEMDAFRGVALRVMAFQVAIAVAFTAVFALLGEDLLRALFGPEYAASAPVLVTMSVALIVSSLAAFGSTVLTAGRRLWLQCANIVVATVVQVPALYVLIGAGGVLGAAWAEVLRTVAAVLFLTLAGMIIFRRRRRQAAGWARM